MARGLVPSTALIGIDEFVRQMGGDPIAIAKRVGLPVAAFSDPDLPVPSHAPIEFLECVAQSCRCPDLGLQVAQRKDLSVLGPLFVLMSIAATVGDALDLLSRHLGLHTSALVVNTRSVPEGLTIEFGTTYRGAGSDRQIMEYGMALITDFMRGYLPEQWRPVFVQFRHASPANLRLHHAIFGANVYFNQEHNLICIDRVALATSIHPTSAETKRLTSRLVRQRGYFDAQGTVNRTHGMVRALLPYSTDCSIAAVANLLGMSTRSLQRNLAEADVTFEAIRDSIRADLAKKYLTQSTMSVAEIADVLGYSQPSAFARSFQRWYGMTPLRFRKAGGALTASNYRKR